MAKQIWASRTGVELDPAINRLNQSLKFDYRLQPYDMELSLVWAGALEQCEAITGADLGDIKAGFAQIAEEWDRGGQVLDEDEDIHMYHERRLTELIGDAGRKLHRGRSRNDQVATGLRLYVRAKLGAVEGQLRAVIGVLCTKADEYKGWAFPGHTHMQQAQVIALGHLLAAQAWKLKGDIESMDLVRQSISDCPLGSGALGGTSLPVDREWIAGELGFERPSHNSVEAVTSRDFVVDMAYVMARLGVHLSQLAEDVILWCSQEFGYAALAGNTVTGSSLLPHKQNPDVFELARGKAGRLTGNLTALLTMLKGLASGYNKDLQEDKEALFDSVETVGGLLPALVVALQGLSFNQDQITGKITAALKSERITNYLIEQGTTFREAYRQAGGLVKYAEKLGVALDRLSAAEIDVQLPGAGTELQQLLAVGWQVQPTGVIGGSSVASVEAQVKELRNWLGGRGD